jgi:DNA-binding CsgD family transcriptional regulator
MAYSPPYHYQWQNPELVKTIYPFRLEKLRHFLVYYKEIDFWKANRNTPVAPKVALEIVQEISRLNLQLTESKKALESAKAGLKDLERKNQEFLRNRTVLLTEQKKINLKAQLARQNTKIRALNDSIAWYQNYAKAHPEVLQSVVYKRRETDLAEAKEAYSAILGDIDRANAAIQMELNRVGLGGIETERERIKSQIEGLTGQITRLTEGIARLPQLGKSGEVTPGTAVRWSVLKYERELEGKDQAQLVEEILARFAAEPARFPKWLQYMILHFSGMRYKSAHGSWASPRDLLEMVKIEEYEKWALKEAKPEELDQECALAIQALEQRKPQAARPQDLERIKWQIIALNDRFNRQTALVKFHTTRITEEVCNMTDAQALDEIKGMKEIFPPWVWKEITSRTDLRLETTEENWEMLTPEEVKLRWDWKNRYWREIMDTWEGKDITGWRKQHEVTLSLVVTRAVCNEIAEHIQHLRGVTPAGGLTAKPAWYMKMQKASMQAAGQAPPQGADLPYFKPPGQQTREDYKPGASILWLGWVNQRPNIWQITRPLEGVHTLPPRDAWTPYAWNYRLEGGEYIREANTAVRSQAAGKKRPGRPGQGQMLKNWLRWTHEAIVVEVAEMAGGVEYVLTFETGQIGLRLRPLKELLNNPYVYIGYVPSIDQEPDNLPKMISPATLLPAGSTAPAGGISFEIPWEEPVPAPEPPIEETRWQIWQSLTRREVQVVTLICSRKTIPEIAERLEIKRSTVKKHLQNAMRKFDVHSRDELKQVVADVRSSRD